ncbi:MAG: UDP-2,3-diacylglucosamine diphosphatase [Bacteroidetes bacterium]|nr:MAG: UDP-2,3-diacylglucosamine diphosphatase [Bacteroidota bacterium]
MRRTFAPLFPVGSDPHKAVFIASDLHAGAPSRAESLMREKHFVRWLEFCAPQAAAFYLLGDLWDFWFEYRRAVPRGYVRLLGALAALTDAGIPVFFQAGNHDLWLMGYLTEEVGLQRLADPFEAEWQGQTFFLSHGHRWGPMPWWDRLMYALLENPFLGGLYRLLHPDLGLWLGRFFSGRSRRAHAPLDDIDLGPREYLRQFVQQAQNEPAPAQWYVFGHRHLALVEAIGRSHLVLLGDWIRRYTFFRVDRDGWGLYRYHENQAEPLYVGYWASAAVG